MSLLTNVLKFIKANRELSHLVIADTFDEALLLKDQLAAVGLKADIATMRPPSCPYVSLNEGLLNLEQGKTTVLIGMRQVMLQGYRVKRTETVRAYAFSSTLVLARRDCVQFLGRDSDPSRTVASCIKVRPESTAVLLTPPKKKKKSAKKKSAKALSKLVKYLRKHRDEVVQQKKILTPCNGRTDTIQSVFQETIEYVDFDKLCSSIDRFVDQLRWE